MLLHSKNESVFDKVNKPIDCILLSAFSLSEEEFFKDLEETTKKEYAKLIAVKYKLRPSYLWLNYHLSLVKQIKEVSDFVKKLGVAVKLSTTLETLHDLAPYKVVTIVAHYSGPLDQIELSDGLHSVEEVVEHIDTDFKGIIDATVCESVRFQDEIKKKFGDNIFVRANRDLAELKFGLVVYRNVIEQLNNGSLNYLSTSLKLRAELFAFIKNKIKNNE